MGFILFAQDPVFQEEEEIAVCEPFVAAKYDKNTQILTLRYEGCDRDFLFIDCPVGFCGFGELDAGKGYDRELMVGSLNGTVHYQQSFSAFQTIPETMNILRLNLNDGIYFVRVKTYFQDEVKVLYVKFSVS